MQPGEPVLALTLVDAAGKPVRPAILATDSRAFAEANRLAEGDAGRKALAVTGQVPAPYSPAALLAWLQSKEPAALVRARWLLHCKDWLRFRLTSEIATDPTEASHSFTDAATQTWSDEVLALYGLEISNTSCRQSSPVRPWRGRSVT